MMTGMSGICGLPLLVALYSGGIADVRWAGLAIGIWLGPGAMYLYWAFYIRTFRRSAATGGAVLSAIFAIGVLAGMLVLLIRGVHFVNLILPLLLFGLFVSICRNCVAARRLIAERESRGFEPLPDPDDLPMAVRKEHENNRSH